MKVSGAAGAEHLRGGAAGGCPASSILRNSAPLPIGLKSRSVVTSTIALRALMQSKGGWATFVAFHVPLRIHCSQPGGSSGSLSTANRIPRRPYPIYRWNKKNSCRSGLFKWMVFGLIGQTCQPLFSRVPFSIFMDTVSRCIL